MAVNPHQQLAARAAPPTHLPWLDGLRGIAALWVLLHHTFILVGGRGMPILSWGKLAVDLFMILSGFLMAHHYLLRRVSRPWEDAATWRDFWARRWFRISPLYFVLLTAALLLGPFIGTQRDLIAQVWPATATAAARYNDSSWTNVLMHVSYLFGAFPNYAFRTALPDWSIGLEMQFYLAFPFLMLAMHWFGALRAGAVLIAVCLGLRWAFPDFFRSFPMPSFLPLKLYVFIIGIWMALALAATSPRKYLLASVSVSVLYVGLERSTEAVGRVFVVLALFYMVLRSASAIRNRIAAMLSSRLARFMGDTSYGLYLLHLLIVIPVAGCLSTVPQFLALHLAVRLVLCAVIVAAPSYLGAWVLYRLVETRGIAWGKRLLASPRVTAAASISG
ncbi:acyltransferase [uncultured Ramlibacter sp.]|uniref:acyltransferase family protein n=1 Tax=uncultured Ramlibacter sp. TaxID=260755 RepID=UPI00262CBB24|nr:acyltransferase [uncultured Ramlibacter sp.]